MQCIYISQTVESIISLFVVAPGHGIKIWPRCNLAECTTKAESGSCWAIFTETVAVRRVLGGGGFSSERLARPTSVPETWLDCESSTASEQN